jgi:hypothetical protein
MLANISQFESLNSPSTISLTVFNDTTEARLLLDTVQDGMFKLKDIKDKLENELNMIRDYQNLHGILPTNVTVEAYNQIQEDYSSIVSYVRALTGNPNW